MSLHSFDNKLAIFQTISRMECRLNSLRWSWNISHIDHNYEDIIGKLIGSFSFSSDLSFIRLAFILVKFDRFLIQILMNSLRLSTNFRILRSLNHEIVTPICLEHYQESSNGICSRSLSRWSENSGETIWQLSPTNRMVWSFLCQEPIAIHSQFHHCILANNER
jgi:hypothetical protein